MIRALAALALGAGVAAAEPIGPLETRVARMDACIGQVGAPDDHAQWCKGLVAEPCVVRLEVRSTDGEVACITSETEAWDAILAREYAALSRVLNSEQRRALEDKQRRWRAFRDADCAFPAVFVPGDPARPWTADCHLHHAADRALTLRGYRDYLEN